MKVFLAGASLAGAYGGPAVSVSRLALSLSDPGHEVGLWAADQSASQTPLLPPGAAVCRLTGPPAQALNSFGRPDVIHDNGIWLSHNHRLAALAARCAIPRIVSTRGMLEPWAMAHKRWKKRLAWRLYQSRDLKEARCHHATSESEARNLTALRLGVPIEVVPNGVDVPQSCVRERDRASENKTALFMGRIYPVKGLPMLIEAWNRVRPQGWQLRIAGPDEGGHRAEVEQAILVSGLSESVSFVGPVDGATKEWELLHADLLVLPSHSESFGMAVAEALAHGVPVLTTKRTPWQIVSERGCGWCVEATIDGIVEGLRDATSRDAQLLSDMGQRGRELVAAKFQWDSVADRFLGIYRSLTS